MLVHWLPERAGIAVEVEITLDDTLLVKEAHELARRAREAIERIDDVIEADLHLEVGVRVGMLRWRWVYEWACLDGGGCTSGHA
jgi:hypothetical protein